MSHIPFGRTLNQFQNSIDVCENLIVPETQYTVAFPLNESRPHRVTPPLFRVLPAINFNNELETMTGEIDDVRT